MRTLFALMVFIYASCAFAEVKCSGMDLTRSYTVNVIDNIVERAAVVTIDDGEGNKLSNYIAVAMNVKDDTVQINGKSRDFSLIIDRFQEARIYQAFMTFEEYSVPLECLVF